ncbi:hypothetical protein NS263_04050 [Curtobacterium oceanosedimentum]|uniref:RNA polymerase sigma factor 70 region 4 type 2 domain-containing protein n=1 Tax=Curtobacterium oceanosedimentum TaxID=465820 RepID=A0ABR5SBM4_9MICO|nr:sigma factor-like helix-turn-helix DNA-binding protein [Curtobacterium oceanosedimentum]KTR41657.1 hypothetical protein NS263_04050 [Curtobacterium oceanosedimentum]
MTDSSREALEIRTRARAARDDVIRRLRATNHAYRKSEIDRRDLMVAATEFGLSIRQIAELIDENPSSVAHWIKRAREAEFEGDSSSRTQSRT